MPHVLISPPGYSFLKILRAIPDPDQKREKEKETPLSEWEKNYTHVDGLEPRPLAILALEMAFGLRPISNKNLAPAAERSIRAFKTSRAGRYSEKEGFTIQNIGSKGREIYGHLSTETGYKYGFAAHAICDQYKRWSLDSMRLFTHNWSQ